MWIEIAGLRILVVIVWSRLARALWIEIGEEIKEDQEENGRGSREPCGLKLDFFYFNITEPCRGSREPCGLKYSKRVHEIYQKLSRLARALWIEIIQGVPPRQWIIVEARESLVD